MKKFICFVLILLFILPLGAYADGITVDDTEPSSETLRESEDISEENGIWGDANGFDKFMIGFMSVVLSFSALCVPVYIILDIIKRKDKRAKASEDTENDR